MASTYYILGSDGSSTVYLVNSSGTPTPGGSPGAAGTTPYGIRAPWALTRAGRLDNWVDETIPLVYLGTSTDGALAAMDALRTLVDDPMTGLAALVVQPNGA